MTERETLSYLAQALYETDTGTNGYPPLHESIPWAELTYRDHYMRRATDIVARMAVARAAL